MVLHVISFNLQQVMNTFDNGIRLLSGFLGFFINKFCTYTCLDMLLNHWSKTVEASQ